MKTKFFLRLLSLMAMLFFGTFNTWAWDHEETFTDDGNEDSIF